MDEREAAFARQSAHAGTAAKVRDLNFKYLAEGKGADKVFQRIYDRAI